jgi:hypothetical protein
MRSMQLSLLRNWIFFTILPVVTVVVLVVEGCVGLVSFLWAEEIGEMTSVPNHICTWQEWKNLFAVICVHERHSQKIYLGEEEKL